jgi:hypothetical protein
VRTGTLTEEHLAKIRAVERTKKDARAQIVEGDLDGYRILFVGDEGKPGVLELAKKRTEVVQYILVLLSDLLDSTSRLSAHPHPYMIANAWTMNSNIDAITQAPPLYQKPSSSPATHTSTSSRCSPTPPTPKTLYPSSPRPSWPA